MPEVTFEQELINRLQQQIGVAAGAITTKDIQIQILLGERDQLRATLTELGANLPPSQIQTVEDQAKENANGYSAQADTGSGEREPAVGPSHQPRPKVESVPGNGIARKSNGPSAAKVD